MPLEFGMIAFSPIWLYRNYFDGAVFTHNYRALRYRASASISRHTASRARELPRPSITLPLSPVTSIE